jgi:hypothetical protein
MVKEKVGDTLKSQILAILNAMNLRIQLNKIDGNHFIEVVKELPINLRVFLFFSSLQFCRYSIDESFVNQIVNFITLVFQTSRTDHGQPAISSAD